MKTILEVLEAVDAKLDSPEKWTKGWNAKNNIGQRVTENSPAACCWCLVGAVVSISGDLIRIEIADNIVSKTLNFLKIQSGETFLYNWNDLPSRTFSEVKSFISIAKEKARCEQL